MFFEVFSFISVKENSSTNAILAFVIVSAISYFINPIYIFWPGALDAVIGAFVGGYLIASKEVRLTAHSVGVDVGLKGGFLFAVVQTLIDYFIFYYMTLGAVIVVGGVNLVFSLIGGYIGARFAYSLFGKKVTGKKIVSTDVDKKYTEGLSTQALSWNDSGVDALERGNFQEALMRFEKAIELEPTSVVAWTNKGVALKNLGRYQDALNTYNYAIQLDPTYPKAWYNRGNVLVKLKRYDEALKSYEQAIRLNPRYELAKQAYANLKRTLGR